MQCQQRNDEAARFVTKRLIRNQATRRYLTRRGGWTDDPTQAWGMFSILQAAQIAAALQLSDVEVVIRFVESDSSGTADYCLPLSC